MDVSSISSVVASPPALSAETMLPTSAPAASGSVTTTSLIAPADTVVLSQAAQQALASAASAQPDTSTKTGDDAVQQAITALNDTSSKFSIADQLQAYGLVANFVKSQTTPQAAASAVTSEAVTTLYDSPFAQHAQQLLNKIGSNFDWSATNGNNAANSIDNALSAFNALSTTDQQIYVGAIGLQHQMVSGETPITTVDDYRANLEAQANVDRALQAAVSSPAYASAIANAPDSQADRMMGVTQGLYGKRDDLAGLAAAAGDEATTALVKLTQTAPDTTDWTQQVQAYFAKYGPPPTPSPDVSAGSSNSTSVTPSSSYQVPDGKTMAAAIAAVNDTTGKAAFADQVSAYQTLQDYARSGQDYGLARTATSNMFASSPFAQQVNAAAQGFFSNSAVMAAYTVGSGSDPTKSVAALLGKQSAQQQELIFLGAGYGEGFTSLDDWKTQLIIDQAKINAENSSDQNISLSTSSSSVGNVTSSSSPTRTATQPLTTLTSGRPSHSDADTALFLLQSAGTSVTVEGAKPSSKVSITA